MALEITEELKRDAMRVLELNDQLYFPDRVLSHTEEEQLKRDLDLAIRTYSQRGALTDPAITAYDGSKTVTDLLPELNEYLKNLAWAEGLAAPGIVFKEGPSK